MRSIYLMFLMVLIGMISFTSCSSETEQITEPNKKANISTSKLLEPGEFDDYESIVDLINDYVKNGTTTCSTCKCNVDGYYHSPGTGAGIGIYHVTCSSGNQYNVVYDCAGNIQVYSGDSTVPIPRC